MKTTTVIRIMMAMGVTLAMASCKRDNNPIPEIPASEGTEITLNGGEGGSAAENTVFVDFSADKQYSMKRASWNLGFYSGEKFRVILNNTAGASAIKLNKTDLNAVSEQDVNLDDLTIALGTAGAFGNIDDLTGDINKTLIPEVSFNDTDNQVIVMSVAGGSHGAGLNPADLFKVRILRNGNDYTVQYAKLNATIFQTLTIKKDRDFNFNYFSFEKGLVEVEPTKTDWDFQWTWSLYFGGSGAAMYPYGYSDLIFINHLAGVTAAEVIFKDAEGKANGNVSYEEFGEKNLSGITFSNARGVIGANWRVTPSPSPGVVAGARKDRFYLLKDGAGNVYKIRFNSFTPEDAGKRGFPELEYKLVKRG